ncbi:MAG: immunoglobulin-like domain-containing protein [Mobilitalea sp.]
MIFTKKLTGLFIMGIICYMIMGCSGEDTSHNSDELNWENARKGIEELEGVWIETEYETYEVGTTSVRVKWYNTLQDSMMYGEYYDLENKVDGVWKRVNKETDIDYAFNDIGLLLFPSDTRWHNYGLICYTDGLALGEYRIATTFIRESIDGVAYTAGKYPNYQVYGYFYVGEKSIKRNMFILDDTKIEYLNEEYHFSIYLPKEWEGYQIITAKETVDDKLNILFKKIDEDYVVIIIRHPKWSIKEPYQDIALVVFKQDQWNKNVSAATNENFDLLPEMVSGGSYFYVITIDPPSYDNTLRGYDEVMGILGDDYFSGQVRDY